MPYNAKLNIADNLNTYLYVIRNLLLYFATFQWYFLYLFSGKIRIVNQFMVGT